MLPNATSTTGFIGGVRVPSDRNGKLAENVSRLFAHSRSLMNRKCSIIKDVCVILYRILIFICCLFWFAFGFVYVCVAFYEYIFYLYVFLPYLVYLIFLCLFGLQLYGLVRFIHAGRDLYKRRHIMERLDILKTCFSECGLFFGVLLVIAIISIVHNLVKFWVEM